MKKDFPDGQINFGLTEQEVHKFLMPPSISGSMGIRFAMGLENWDKFQTLIAANAKFRQYHDKVSVDIGYLFGSRSDRQFEEGGINYFRDVIAKTINDQGFSSVTVFDPHSLAVENAIHNCKIIPPDEAVIHVFRELIKYNNVTNYEFVICSPDLGAYKKVFGLFTKISKQFSDLNINFVSANKIRDLDGNIQMTLNEPYRYFDDSKIQVGFVIDDICDGGRTFIEFAKLASSEMGIKDINLYVSHGIFSKGLEPLLERFNHIYTTNSIPENSDKYYNHDRIDVIDIFTNQRIDL